MGLVLQIAATLLRHQLQPAMVSLAVVYSLQMMSLFAHVIRSYADVENNMTAVERIDALMRIGKEGAPSASTSEQAQVPPRDWPRSEKAQA